MICGNEKCKGINMIYDSDPTVLLEIYKKFIKSVACSVCEKLLEV